MKCLTIQQPYAHLIVTRQDNLPEGAHAKAVENRKWLPTYRGPLLIHAGMSLEWMNVDHWPPLADKGYYDRRQHSAYPEFSFGAIVGIVELATVIHVNTTTSRLVLGTYPWLKDNPHVFGPWCWLLKNRWAFPEPIPYRGQQGLFDVPDEVVQEQIQAIGWEPTMEIMGE